MRRAREELGWTQAELAKRMSDVGVSLHASAIAKIEAATRSIRINEAAAIADILGCPLDQLVEPPSNEWQEVLDVFTQALRMHRDAETLEAEAWDLIRSLAADFSADAPVASAAPELQPQLVRVLAALEPYTRPGIADE